MGTLTNQPDHTPRRELHTLAAEILQDARQLAKREGVTLEHALRVFEIAARERHLDLGYSRFNVHDEQVAGLAEMLANHWDVRAP